MTIEKLSLAPVARFYHQNDHKFILVIVILLSLYLIAFLAQLTWQLLPSPDNTAVQPLSNLSAQADMRVTDSKSNLNKLLALNLFGDPAAKPEPVQETVTEAPQTRLNLLLSGVVASPNPQIGAAVIEYRNAQNTYGIGDKIDGTQVTLDEIYSDRVIIKNRTTRETLMLDGVDFEEANRLREKNQPIETSNVQGPEQSPSTAESPSRQQVAAKLRAAQQKLSQEPTNFADFIRLTPYSQNGTPVGYRVSPGKEPILFQEVGLQEGDVVTELNGYDLSDIQQALEALSLLNDAQSLDLEIIRREEMLSLSFDIPRD
jgi:general secretion pathway protein C